MSYYRGGDRMGGLGSNLRNINWNEVQSVSSQWNFYKPQEQRPEEEIKAWMAENKITIYGDRVPQPMLQFSDLVAPDAIHQSFVDAKYDKPTAIQSIAWPILLNSRDIVAIARTGSGKTMGFIIPAALHIMAQPPLQPGDGPIALVLAPTRELAVQIETESRKALHRIPNIISTCIYGGAPKGPQVRDLRAGVHICIATPGRLIDFLEPQQQQQSQQKLSAATNLLRVTFLVLDEADRMLDMGFEDQIRKICSQIRTDRQTMMFSATWPREIRNLAASFQRDFVRVHVGSEELVANADVRQHVLVVEAAAKEGELEAILQKVGPQRVLIFVKTKRTADALQSRLRYALRGTTVMAIHGDKEQASRDYVLDRFRNDERAVLVATDVAARGLDVKNLDVVVNYDLPTNIEDYVHRIGRTGRAGQSGDAYTFVCRLDPAKTIRDLVGILLRAKQEVSAELMTISAYAQHSGGGGRFRGRGGGRGYGRGYSRGYGHHNNNNNYNNNYNNNNNFNNFNNNNGGYGGGRGGAYGSPNSFSPYGQGGSPNSSAAPGAGGPPRQESFRPF